MAYPFRIVTTIQLPLQDTLTKEKSSEHLAWGQEAVLRRHSLHFQEDSTRENQEILDLKPQLERKMGGMSLQQVM